MYLELPGAERPCMPDGFFITYRLLQKRCRFKRGAHNAVTAIRGLPNLIMEIASPSCLEKDYEDKLKQYERSGVKEFWLFRPTGAGYVMDLLNLDRTGRYYRSRLDGGGYSRVLKCFCKLHCLPTFIRGLPRYELSLNPESTGEKLFVQDHPVAASNEQQASGAG